MEKSQISPFKTRLRKLIANGNINEAFGQLKLVFKRIDDFEQELIIIESRLSRLSNEETKGTLDHHDEDRIKNRIIDDLMKFYERVDHELANFISFKKIEISKESLEEQLKYKIKDQYLISSPPLGEGGTSIIFKATQRFSGKPVAVRALKNQEFSDKLGQIIFKNLNLEDEVKHLLKIKHRNVIKIIDFFLDDFPACYIEEFVNGPTLKKLLENFGAFPLERTINIVYQLSKALYYLHSKGIVHKRLRPSKVFIDSEGIPVITPFQELTNKYNSADLLYFHHELKYLSPEELDGQAPDDKSDQFTLGLLAYELIKGEALFEGDTIMEVLKSRNKYFGNSKHRNAIYEELDIPTRLSSTIKKMLAQNPNKRYRCVKDAGEIFRKYNLKNENEANRIVEQSYRRCRANNAYFARDFYINLFAFHPELLHHFSTLEADAPTEKLALLEDFQAKLKSHQENNTVELRHSVAERIPIPDFIRTPNQMLRDVFSLIWISKVNTPLLKDIITAPYHDSIQLDQFKVFLNNLIHTAAQNDYLWDEKIEENWDKITSDILSAIEQIRRKST